MNNDKEKEKILQKAVQLITSEISIKIYTKKFIQKVTISPKMDSESTLLYPRLPHKFRT